MVKLIVYMLLYILVFKEITTILQTNIYKIDKQQGPTIEHRELYSISCNYPYGKEKIKTINIFLISSFTAVADIIGL